MEGVAGLAGGQDRPWRSNAYVQLRADKTVRERSELPWSARQLQRSFGGGAPKSTDQSRCCQPLRSCQRTASPVLQPANARKIPMLIAEAAGKTPAIAAARMAGIAARNPPKKIMAARRDGTPLRHTRTQSGGVVRTPWPPSRSACSKAELLIPASSAASRKCETRYGDSAAASILAARDKMS